jgi:hypothetical protein
MPDAGEQCYEVQLTAEPPPPHLDPPPPTEDIGAPSPTVGLSVIMVKARSEADAVDRAVEKWYADKGHEPPPSVLLVRQVPSEDD